MVGLEEKIFKAKRSDMVVKRYFDIGFCTHSMYFLNVLLTVVQALYSLQLFKKLPKFDDVMKQYCLNFLKILNLGVVYPAQPQSLSP